MKFKISFLLLWITCLVQAQVTIENLLNVPFPTNLISSADGKRIAWVFNDQGMRNIWVAEVPDLKARKLTQYTQDDGQELSALKFTPDGDKIVFIRGSFPNAQGEFPNPLTLQQDMTRAIWVIQWNGESKKLVNGSYPVISPDGKKIAYLSGGQVWTVPTDGSAEAKKLFQSRGTPMAMRWSPDGTKLAFSSHRGDHTFAGIFDLQTSTVHFPDASADNDNHIVWSPDGKEIAYIRTPTTSLLPFTPRREGYPWSIRVLDIASGKAREIWKALPGKGSVLHDAQPAIDNFLFWASNSIVFPWERDGWMHLYSVSSNGGEAKLLTPGDGEVELASLSPDNKDVIYTANIGDIDRRHVWKVAADGTSQPKQLSAGDGIEWSAVQTSQGWACLRSDATTAAWPFAISPSGQIKMIGQEFFPKTFPKKELVTPQAVTITAADGMKIPAQLFLPKNHKTGEKHPALVYFHGGSRRQMLLGFNYGAYYHNAYSLHQYFASRGYVVLSVNFRSGIGYGLDFREAIDYGAAGASEFNDVRGAGEYIKQRDDVDVSRIGVWGGSYGGYMTGLALTRAADIFACGVDIHGVHDWNVVVKNFQPTYVAEKNQAFAKKAFESSPMNFVKSWKAPVLLIHGDDDRNVPFSETVTLLEKLRAQNVHVEQVVVPDEVHLFLLHKSWLKVYSATVDFFKRQFEE
ncbi:MAG: prolyl oligopeptidase family serine peptidase [Bacteroidota bacterium]